MLLLKILGLLVLTLATGLTAAGESIDELKAKADAAEGGKRAELFAELAYEYVLAADHHFTEGRPADGHQTVQLVVAAAEQARDAAIAAHKKLKKAEITLRKAARKLEDVRRSLAFEDQKDVAQAVERLKDIQDEILEAMFAPKKQAEKKS